MAEAPASTTVSDPTAVFQKAFWKRPTPDDRILHAERREWADENGVTKWQWFISVQPSGALVNYLITENAFMLSQSSSPLPASIPSWFPKTVEEAASYSNATGTFRIVWDKKANLLHATDSGTGFRPGAPAPIQAITATPPQPSGRLPTTPPPRP